MAHANEAVCLHETGVLYGRRTLLEREGKDPVFAGFKPGAFSLYYGDAPIFHFDREGRWQRCYVDDRHYLRGLDGVVQSIDRVREGANLVLKRRTLNLTETIDLDTRVRGAALDLLDALAEDRLRSIAPPPRARPVSRDELRDFLEKVARWDVESWAADASDYMDAYGPLPFLPPDCTSPVILQATIGDAGARGFGGAETLPLETRSPEEFVTHTHAVARLLGERVSQCKSVLLGGADALRQPVAHVASYLETIRDTFPIDATGGHRHPDPTEQTPHRLDGVHAFLRDFRPPLPTRDDWRGFRSLGLTRVTLSVEPENPADLSELVADLKDAGIGVGLVVLLGAGGAESVSRELESIPSRVNHLPLGQGDLVSLIDAREACTVSEPLNDAEYENLRDQMKTRLAPVRERKVKVVPFSLEKQRQS